MARFDLIHRNLQTLNCCLCVHARHNISQESNDLILDIFRFDKWLPAFVTLLNLPSIPIVAVAFARYASQRTATETALDHATQREYPCIHASLLAGIGCHYLTNFLNLFEYRCLNQSWMFAIKGFLGISSPALVAPLIHALISYLPSIENSIQYSPDIITRDRARFNMVYRSLCPKGNMISIWHHSILRIEELRQFSVRVFTRCIQGKYQFDRLRFNRMGNRDFAISSVWSAEIWAVILSVQIRAVRAQTIAVSKGNAAIP